MGMGRIRVTGDVMTREKKKAINPKWTCVWAIDVTVLNGDKNLA